MRYGSVCSGIEAASCAWVPMGWEPAWFSEIDPFASAVLAERYPYVENLGDMRGIGGQHGPIDVLVGGTPCFPAGTLVATDRGFVPIECVRVGDLALTHEGRFRRVVRVGSKQSATVRVKGQGHHGFVTTPNHPFLSRQISWKSARVDGQFLNIKSVSNAEWVAAENLAGKHWACVADWPDLGVPEVVLCGRENREHPLSKELFLLAGAYIGDGWARFNQRRGCVVLGINESKLELLRPALDSIGTWSSRKIRTGVRVEITSRPLARWLVAHFGIKSCGKSIPMWAIGMRREWREALIDGYVITDGGRSKTTGISATTISRDLAITMRSLAVSCGYASSVGHFRRPETCEIEGRIVNQSDTYTVTFSPSNRMSFYEGGNRWQRVRSVEPTGEIDTVYDLEIEEDHSYVADGIVVHNCQPYSQTGKRQGLADARGDLTLHYARLLGVLRPRWFVLENVPGLVSIADQLVFKRFLEIAVEECGYGVSWRVLDSRYFGIPQRRRRLFVVGCSGGRWRRAAAVLLDARGHRENVRKARTVRRATSVPGDPGSVRPTVVGWSGDATPKYEIGVSPTLRANQGGEIAGCARGGRARRFTAIEWERLQGFKDDYTAVQFKGKPASYKQRITAIGNSFPVPMLRWIGEGIKMCEEVINEAT